MTSTKPTIIYIVSNGRSGSTILDIMLGGSNEGFTTGELHLLPYELRTDHLPCGCGKQIHECKLWNSILQKKSKPWLEKDPAIDLFRDREGVGKVFRWRYLPSILFGIKSKLLQTLAVDYGLNNHGLFTDIEQYAKKEKATSKYLIDASKDLYRLLLLKLSNQFDLKVIHLTKAPQGFVFSMTKDNSSPTRIFRMSVRWLVENYLIVRIRKRHFTDHSFVHLKYEDFAKAPQENIQRIADQLKITLTNVNTENFRAAKTHGISGNISRYDNRPFRPDFKWKEKLSRRSILLIKLITFLTARLLKY